MTEKGQFDEKLFNIISRSIIRVPSLRSRRDDIPMLSVNIIEELSKQHHYQALHASKVITSGAGVREGAYLCDLLRSSNHTNLIQILN